MSNNLLSLSLVIPAYNEENHLQACLESVAAQTVMPDEVIVVDNNSVDGTAAIAGSFPFVTLVTEPVQGLIAARNHGFMLATGDILGRIDADAILDEAWVERVLADFSDDSVMGVTGLAYTDSVPMLQNRLQSKVWSWVYFIDREAKFGTHILWGANMAIRKNAWRRIKDDVCLDDTKVHEDQDLSLLIAGCGGKLVRDNKLVIQTSGQQYHAWPKFSEYVRRASMTKYHHIRKGTLGQAGATRLSVAQRSWRYALTCIPRLLFIGSSFLFWLPLGLYDGIRSRFAYGLDVE